MKPGKDYIGVGCGALYAVKLYNNKKRREKIGS